jgi:hypothetical protein
MLKMTLFMR